MNHTDIEVAAYIHSHPTLTPYILIFVAIPGRISNEGVVSKKWE